MSISGPQALASLEEAMRDIRREEDDIARRLARTAEVTAKIKESEAELFRQLAQSRRDPSIQAELDGRIAGAESKARETLKAHSREVELAQQAIVEIEAERTNLVTQRAAAVAALAEQQGALDALLARVDQALATDPTYLAKRQAAEELTRTAALSLEKTQRAETDRDEKGKPYRDDPLFSYLWNAGFGTDGYKANGVVRYFDGLVAGLVGFAKAGPNFAMLNELPLRLREHAERQRANAAAAETELTSLAEQAADAAGGGPLRAAKAKAEDDIAAIDAAIVAAEDRRDAAGERLQALTDGSDPALASAAAALASALGQDDIQTLLAEARLNRSGEDDTIVAQIDESRARLREEEDEARDLRERGRILAARRRELEDIQWEFKTQRFDDPRSTFREDRLVGDLLDAFLRGAISAASYWDQWRRNQAWSPESVLGSSGSTGPKPKSGGGFSRPRTGKAGNSQHAGFVSGGRVSGS